MQVSQDVLAVLSRAETTGNELKLVDQLDRQLYTRTNKVLEAAGGKWDRKAQAHLFDIEAAIRLDPHRAKPRRSRPGQNQSLIET